MTDRVTVEVTILRERIGALRRGREVRKSETGRRRRTSLNLADRALVLAKTAGHCHICGGRIEGAHRRGVGGCVEWSW